MSISISILFFTVGIIINAIIASSLVKNEIQDEKQAQKDKEFFGDSDNKEVKRYELRHILKEMGYELHMYNHSAPLVYEKRNMQQNDMIRTDINLLMKHLGLTFKNIPSVPETRIIEKVATVTKKK